MKRKTVLKKLERLIPSLSYSDPQCAFPVDRDGNEIRQAVLVDLDAHKIVDGKVLRNVVDWVIPRNYGAGEVVEYENSYSEKVRLESKVRLYDGYKKCTLSILDFRQYGNTHSYGTLSIPGCDWIGVDPNTGKEFSQTSSELDKKYPQCKRTHTMHIRRVLFEDDITEDKGDWKGSEVGGVSQRFQDATSLIIHALYVVLSRVEGPLKFWTGETYYALLDCKAIAIVDEKDNVKLRSDIVNILKKIK